MAYLYMVTGVGPLLSTAVRHCL